MSSFIIRHQEWIVIAAILLIFLPFHFLMKRPDLEFYLALLPMVALGFVGIWLMLDTPAYEVDLAWVIATLLMYAVPLYVFLADVLRFWLAKPLTTWRGEKWTKDLEYLYNGLGALGIVGAVSRMTFVSNTFRKLDIIWPAILTTAFVLKFIKTRAEAGEWNKKKL
jgi:uncharacterized membrane protein